MSTLIPILPAVCAVFGGELDPVLSYHTKYFLLFEEEFNRKNDWFVAWRTCGFGVSCGEGFVLSYIDTLTAKSTVDLGVSR